VSSSGSLVTGQNANLARKPDRGTHKAETTTDAATHLISERRVSIGFEQDISQNKSHSDKVSTYDRHWPAAIPTREG
jgi:hypothetical protein